MVLLKQLLFEIKEKKACDRIQLFEHKIYKNIPGTNNSFRPDSDNINTKTLKHSHVYAKQNGKGKELYSVNIDGTGHDGNRNSKIPNSHADFFRSIGYDINPENILESIALPSIVPGDYSLVVLTENNT